MHDGRWRDTEEFLKFGALTNFLYVSHLHRARGPRTRRQRIALQLTYTRPHLQEPKVSAPSFPLSAEMEACTGQFVSSE